MANDVNFRKISRILVSDVLTETKAKHMQFVIENRNANSSVSQANEHVPTGYQAV
jgi:hypothetical protein